MRNIAIIPARSGSKGLPNKNILDLCGKPLVAYSIEAAIKSNKFDVVHVSTDSKEYADIAIEYGADVQFLRNQSTSSDTASSWDVIKEVLDKYASFGKEFDYFMLLQPTSPLRTSEDIVNSFKLLSEKKADSVVSICETEHNPLQCGTIGQDLSMNDFISNISGLKRRQDLDKYYRLNGAIYLSNIPSFIKNNSIYDGNCYAYIMDKKHSVDIDDELDFLFASAVMEAMGTVE